jgi:LuxR family transcriptional regulator, maltose regulon positive regulatory protein
MVINVPKQMTASAPQAAATDPILASKITVPDAPALAVPRPRISELLAGGTRWSPLTVLTGPPGTGKTMALALWAAAEPRAVAWVALDRYDNQPEFFWSHVVAALRRAGVAMPGALSADPQGQGTDHVFLLRLVSALATQDPPVILVLDDFHLLTEPEALKGLDFVLRNVGSGLRVVVSSRTDPPLRLHRYRLAGELAEIRASDLAFNLAEARLLMAQYRGKISADSLECLMRRTEGWAAGLRLAAISMDTHPDPEQFVKGLITEDSALTGYLVEEVLNTQPPEAQEVLLSTSILERVSGEAARELVSNEEAAGILPALARANTFIQPLGSGWYRYHPLFAEVLRLKLRLRFPERIPDLHRRAARLCERNGSLSDAVRHAAAAGDWQLAASMVVGGLAIGEIIQPQGSQPLAREFLGMPGCGAWNKPEPYLVSAGVALAGGDREACAAALTAAEGILQPLPAGQAITARLTASMLRLAASRQDGDLAAATTAADRAEALLRQVPGDVLVRHPGIRAHVLAGRGIVGLWSGHLDDAVHLFGSGVDAATASGAEYEQAECLGYLALAEAMRGGLCRAAEQAARAHAAVTTRERHPPVKGSNPAVTVAMAWVNLERNELGEARRLLNQADAALGASPDKLIGTVAWLVAAQIGLVEARAQVTVQCVAKARSGWSVPGWLEQKLSDVESRACLADGDLAAARAAAARVDCDSSLEATVTHARAWVAAGDSGGARRALAPALAAHGGTAEQVRVDALLVDAQISYSSANPGRGARSLASALRLAEREQLRLPFVTEREWISRALARDPDLARSHQRLLAPAVRHDQLPAVRNAPDQSAIVLVEPLTEREREVLRHVSEMLNTAEVASEMYISINTVKTHLKSIYRKLAVTHRREAVRRAQQLELI